MYAARRFSDGDVSASSGSISWSGAARRTAARELGDRMRPGRPRGGGARRPRGSPPRASPTTSMYGTLRSSASRILRPIDSVRSSTSTRSPASRSSRRDLARVVDVAVGDRQHDRLHGREPERELARVVLDQDADEALERAEQRAVDHHRAGARRCRRRCTSRLEALGHVVVELDGAELPRAPERVASCAGRSSARRRRRRPR